MINVLSDTYLKKMKKVMHAKIKKNRSILKSKLLYASTSKSSYQGLFLKEALVYNNISYETCQDEQLFGEKCVHKFIQDVLNSKSY